MVAKVSHTECLKRLCRGLFWPRHSKAIKFLENPDLSEVSLSCNGVAEGRIFAFWMGGEMTSQRKACLDAMRAISQVPVILVDADNLSEWLVPEDPLPAVFPFLSAVHKADYLRVYFMYHHGGGYSDVKRPERSWRAAFETINAASQKFALGYPEPHPVWVQTVKPRGDYRKRDVYHFNYRLKEAFSSLIGNGAYIFKPKSPLMRIVLTEQKRRIALVEKRLLECPGDPFGKNEGYPLPWCYILGEIFHPAQMAFRDYLIYSNDVRPSFVNYR